MELTFAAAAGELDRVLPCRWSRRFHDVQVEDRPDALALITSIAERNRSTVHDRHVRVTWPRTRLHVNESIGRQLYCLCGRRCWIGRRPALKRACVSLLKERTRDTRLRQLGPATNHRPNVGLGDLAGAEVNRLSVTVVGGVRRETGAGRFGLPSDVLRIRTLDA